MPSGIETANDAAAERNGHSPNKGLESFFRDLEPALKGIAQLGELVRPFTESMERLATIAAPFVHAAELCMKRWDTAESLVERGWVPNSTTPFDLVEEFGDDTARLQEALLVHYSDNWSDVKERLEASVSSRDIDDEAKAVFREALDAHERRLYRCVSRLLFPEFERVFSQALLDEEADRISYAELIEKLTGESGNLGISDFMLAGIQDMVLFKYLTEDKREPRTPADLSDGPAPGYTPGLYVNVNKTNHERAEQSQIPTRHAIAHGLVAYSSQQSSLNALFIADYVFFVVSEVWRKKAEDAARTS